MAIIYLATMPMYVYLCYEKILSRCGDVAVRGIDRKRSRSGKLRSGKEMRGKAQRLQDVFIKLSTRLIYQRPLSPMLGLGIRDGGLSLGRLRLEISQQDMAAVGHVDRLPGTK